MRPLARVVAVVGLLVVAVAHLELAPLYDSAATVLTPGILFRGEAVAAAITAVAILQFDTRAAYLAGAVVAGVALTAVLAYRWLDLDALGPIPDMYEPFWYPGKVVAMSAAAVATAAAGGLLLDHRRHRTLRESLGVFVLDRLDAEDRAHLRRHLDRCAACRSEVDELAPVVELLARPRFPGCDGGRTVTTTPESRRAGSGTSADRRARRRSGW